MIDSTFAAAAVGWAMLTMTPAPGVDTEFDSANPPVRVGATLGEVLSNWGERASFGADCGSWRGPSVDRDFRWRGARLRVMALLKGERVAAVRYEQAAEGSRGFAECDAQLTVFQSYWSQSGIVAGADSEVVYDGPVKRRVRGAGRQATAVGRFEADYRASRTECRLALILTEP